jgi:Golgi phosphoprotein 3 (GPP34)
METLGDDLVLLAILPNGVIGAAAKLQYGLSGSELVRLTALRRIGIERGEIVVLDQAPTGDVLLDEALASLHDSPTAQAWVARNRDGLVRRYLERLAGTGTIRLERRKALGFIPVNSWTVLDSGRMAAARARLDAIAYGTSGVGMPEAALAGLASAIGLPPLVYPGFRGSAARRRITRAASASRSNAETTQTGSTSAADATDAATRPATDAAVGAATEASVRASIQATTQAVISAATDAAHHVPDGSGHAGGHH